MSELTSSTTTAPRPFVFVLMPFDKKFDDVYKLGIKESCDQAGAYCERVDEQLFDESILERVYNQISKADLLIADMTDRNPNVFYEVGYAHALGRRVILLTQRSEDIPFDLKHYPHIVYQGRITELKESLLPRIKWALEENSKGKSQFFDPTLECRIMNVPIRNNPEVVIDIAHPANFSSFHFSMEFHNSSKRDVRFLNFKVGLIVPSNIDLNFYRESLNSENALTTKKFSVEETKRIALTEDWFDMAPGEWLRIVAAGSYKLSLEISQAVLQIITETRCQSNFHSRLNSIQVNGRKRKKKPKNEQKWFGRTKSERKRLVRLLAKVENKPIS